MTYLDPAQSAVLPSGPGDTRVGLRTLVMIRWAALAGQAATLATVHYGLGFSLPIGSAFGIVGASALANLALVARRPLKSRIGAVEASVQLGADILQLSLLLFLTGGLTNPFALLILAPVTVSATVLPRAYTVALGLLAGIAVTVLSVAHFPLPDLHQNLVLPDFYLLGLWEALILGTLFIAAYVGSISEESRRMALAFNAAQLALAREQQMTAVGALAAAAAHELGSPLATIVVTAREMSDDVEPGSDIAADVDLIRQESERCRKILARLGAPLAPDALSPMARLPVGALVESAADPYLNDSVRVVFAAGRDGDRSDEPVVPRRPEIIHGLGTLIQNAIDYARETVRVETEWTGDRVSVVIRDDGPGFARALLERLGEPYVSTRAGEEGHMGLGVFIAETLLTHTGARVVLRNHEDGGALVEVVWNRDDLEATDGHAAGGPATA